MNIIVPCFTSDGFVLSWSASFSRIFSSCLHTLFLDATYFHSYFRGHVSPDVRVGEEDECLEVVA
jgi:hypothetical protein